MAMAAGEEDDLWQGTQGQELKKSRPENVHFAKKAKRVDVKRLKDDIWTGLRTLVPPEPAEPKSESEDEVGSPVSRVQSRSSLSDAPALDTRRAGQDIRLDHSEPADDLSDGEDVGNLHVVLFHLSLAPRQ